MNRQHLNRWVVLLLGIALAACGGRLCADIYDPPAGYYAGATGTGATLKSQLAAAMSAGHVQRTYGDFRFSAAITDADPNHPGNILLVYDRASVGGAWSTNPLIWNREHLWPQSSQPGSASNSTSGNLGDPHALRPSDPGVNSDRGSLPFGFAGTTGSNRVLGSYYFPGDADKGDVARAMFYSATRYASTGLTLTDSTPSGNQMGDLSSLVAWHFLDPPDDFERRRNHAIYSSTLNPNYFTNNRNAFVDHPEFVWSVFVDQSNDSRITIDGGTSTGSGGSTRTVDFGAVLVGGELPAAQSVSLTKSGNDGTYYEVRTSGDASSSLDGRWQAFRTGGTDSASFDVGLAGSTAAAGMRAGTVTIDNLDVTTLGGDGRGASDLDDTMTVQLAVLDHATPSFASDTIEPALELDFGAVSQGSTAATLDFDLANLEETFGFTSGLDLDSVVGTGDTSVFATDVTPFTGVDSLAAGMGRSFLAAIDTSTAGNFVATYDLLFSDEDLPGAMSEMLLTLTLLGEVTAARVAGDFNGDGDVDLGDYNLWTQEFGRTVANPGDGADGNGDGVVGAADFTVWQDHRFTGTGGGSGPLATNVPEPATTWLGTLAIVSLGAMRPRRPRAARQSA